MRTEKGIPLAKVASQLKVDPKNARARLRRVKVPAGVTVGNSWKLTHRGVTWVKSQLKKH